MNGMREWKEGRISLLNFKESFPLVPYIIEIVCDTEHSLRTDSTTLLCFYLMQTFERCQYLYPECTQISGSEDGELCSMPGWLHVKNISS